MRYWHFWERAKAPHSWVRIRSNRSKNTYLRGERFLKEVGKCGRHLQNLFLWLQNEWPEAGYSGHHERSNSRIFRNKKSWTIRFGRGCWHKCRFREAVRTSKEEDRVDEQDHTVVKEETSPTEFWKRRLWSERHGRSERFFAIIWRHRHFF